MNCYSASSIFSFPINTSDCTHGIFEVERNAAKALKNINLIYSEIMSPKESDSDEQKVDEIYLNENFERECSFNEQNHYLKPCCRTLKELCTKCDRFISRCSSCNVCNCSASNISNYKTPKINNNSENSENIHIRCRPGSAPDYSVKVKCTVPKPFSLYEKNEERLKAKEQKIIELKLQREREIENELKIRPNFHPVPKNTHLPLFNKMVSDQEKLKVKRREKCQEILNSAKPFNLRSSSKNTVKAKSSSNLTERNTTSEFKAKPAPKGILSNKVSEKLKNKEEVRRMLMVERAKEAVELSSLPFSQRSITYSRSLTNLLNLNKTQNKEESKPKNISEITKRLYAKKCNETIESWNKKVLLVDDGRKMTNQEKQSLLMEEYKSLNKKEKLPFMYFPVRMSNAAILREKQIRTEILARKEREKRKIQVEEPLKKKSDNDLLVCKLRDLIPSPERENEVEEKVKNFREEQSRRELEYGKELEEIMRRVSEQKLLLERQSKIKELPKDDRQRSLSNKESITDYEEEESTATHSDEGSSSRS